MSKPTKSMPDRSDLLWVLILVSCASLLIFDLVPTVVDGGVTLGQGAFAAAYAAVLVWLGFNAWRRTVWGCPTRSTPEASCPQHGARCASEPSAE